MKCRTKKKTCLNYLQITNNLHFTAASLIMFCYINYQFIWNLTSYKLSLYIIVINCCIHYVVIRPVIVSCGNFLIQIVWILTSKLYVCSISQLHLNKAAPNFQNRACFFVMIKQRGNNPILTSKLYVLFHSLIPSKWICSKLSQQG